MLGSILIIKDLIGFETKRDDKYVWIKDKDGKERRLLDSTGVAEVCNPHAYAALIYKKLERQVKS